jgi:acetoin utilization protein AcuB
MDPGCLVKGGNFRVLVEQIMRTKVVTLLPTNTIADGIRFMKEKKIRHLPIVDAGNNLLGLVNASRLRDASPSIFHRDEHLEDLQKPLGSIMRKDVIIGHPLDFVEEVAGLFYEHRISCLPIIKDDKLVGIITETDLLRTLVELTGAHQPGSQIEIKFTHKPGQLCKILDVIQKRNTLVLSILMYPYKKDDRYKIAAIRVQTMNPAGLIQDLKAAGHDVLWPNLPGIAK